MKNRLDMMLYEFLKAHKRPPVEFCMTKNTFFTLWMEQPEQREPPTKYMGVPIRIISDGDIILRG